MPSWTVEKIDMVCKNDEARPAVERLDTDLMVLCKQVHGHATVKSELRDAQDAASWFEARW